MPDKMQHNSCRSISFSILILIFSLSFQTTLVIAAEKTTLTDENNDQKNKQIKPRQHKPQWSLEFKGGRFKPAIEDWDQFYGNDKARIFSAAFGYRPATYLETGLEIGWMKDNGKGFLPANNTQGGEIKYQFLPVSIYLLFRGKFTANQWLVPYIGGGVTRGYYRANITNQSTIDGAENGSHARVGLQLLLNNLDKKYAASLKNHFDIINSYFFIEAQELKIEIDSINTDLGGRSYQAGILFEF